MRHSDPAACLGLALLRYVRDERPTEEALIAWLGGDAGRYHVLRKAALVILTDGRITLSPHHLSSDGARFRYENRIFLLDENRELIL